MTTAQQYADQAARYATDIARRAAAWIEAMHLEVAEGFPAKTPMNGEPGGSGIGGHGDPTFQATQQRQDQRHVLTEAEGLLVEFSANGKRFCELMARNPVDYRHEQTMRHHRCSGQIDPTCERVASRHHDPDNGSLLDDRLCDDCFATACSACHSKPRAPGCRGMCEADYRRQLRKEHKAA